MDVNGLLEQFRKRFKNQRDKGTKFEELIAEYFRLEPVYASQLSDVWMWKDFPYRGNDVDTGIDLVAKTYTGEFWAIQCKFYEPDTSVNKPDVDTFLSTSSKTFYVDGKKTKFSLRYFVATTDKYGKNAESAFENQDPPVIRLGISDLLKSSIDWDQFALKDHLQLKEKYGLRPHQSKALKDVIDGFKDHDRGKLIMACGTGKTFTSLRIAETLTKGRGNILFFVPSIALVNQTLTEWCAQAEYSFNAVVICSDSKASKSEDNTELLDDLIIPSTTNVDSLKKWVDYTKSSKKNMNFVFSTYQSIEKVHDMQKTTGFHFDLIVCDEAHRTTGVTLSGEDDSSFVKVHDNDYIAGDKRLYMTATPRVYGDAVKSKAKDNDAVLCSMDDESVYGPEFHCLSFGDAVKQNLLSDYKVLILAVDEEYVKRDLQNLLTDGNHELKLDDAVKIMGCWKGLSKVSMDPNDVSFKADPQPMKRAVAFTNRIKDSKALVNMFEDIQTYVDDNHPDEAKQLVHVEIEHIDGTFNAVQKKQEINWLKEDTEEGTCRILTNARCLSEGVDVPALDAVMFLNPRSSIVDIIQSVGRVMRKAEGKTYGYIILPIGISASEEPDVALDNNQKYKLVWEVLQALRSHDDRFDNTINKINLNKKRPDQIQVIGIGENKGQDSDKGKNDNPSKAFDTITLDLGSLEEWQNSIYAKMVKKVGSRLYWEKWAKNVGEIAKAYVERINLLLDKHDKKIDTAMNDFVEGLRNNLNGSITQDDAIEMLAEHLITKPVFDALFGDYEFVKSNPVSRSMQRMLDILDDQALDKEKEGLEKFYESVKKYVDGIDNAEGKQRIIVELYDKFFKIALPKEVERLGIVYTPVECVDFIINSVEKLLNKEFGKSMSDKGVHIIDGFTGTGTFIVRLLQSGIIKPEDLLYKYTNDIHANEIVLLAYYIAAINIEETYHDLSGSKEYVPFEGIVLTDTFQLYEDWKDDEFTQAINEEVLPNNSERAKKQRELPITVCIGNPPYSVGQRSANDNSENLSYEKLDERIAQTYVKNTKTTSNRSLYDAYIRAFRWASDRIEDNGIIGFITNGAYIDNAAMRGFRKCLLDEFTSIYVFNLRGNQRTSGEQSRKEGGKIFGSGSRAPIAITCLVKNSNRKSDGYIHYYDIGDYLNRDQKLHIISEKHDIENIIWKHIVPDEFGNWINKESTLYRKFIPLIDESNVHIFDRDTSGVLTSRDSWTYSFGKKSLKTNMTLLIDTYNKQIDLLEAKNISLDSKSLKNTVIKDPTKISWSRSLINSLKNLKKQEYKSSNVIEAMYRPFVKENLYYSRKFNECVYKNDNVFLNENISICINGTGASKSFSSLAANMMPNWHFIDSGRCFPLYWYEEVNENNLFGEKYIKHNNITDQALNKFRDQYKTNEITKEDIFYYVYGILHSKDYRSKFEADLKKNLPRIPFVNSYSKFCQFSSAGKKLINLHINYENEDAYAELNIVQSIGAPDNKYLLYEISKMKFDKKSGKTNKNTIIYNDYLTITNIPNKAYEYEINGKSAIEWIMERYAVTIDKASGIKNDPNDWSKEHNNPSYIFDLLLSVINVSVQTVDIVNSLPKLNFE